MYILFSKDANQVRRENILQAPAVVQSVAGWSLPITDTDDFVHSGNMFSRGNN